MEPLYFISVVVMCPQYVMCSSILLCFLFYFSTLNRDICNKVIKADQLAKEVV